MMMLSMLYCSMLEWLWIVRDETETLCCFGIDILQHLMPKEVVANLEAVMDVMDNDYGMKQKLVSIQWEDQTIHTI